MNKAQFIQIKKSAIKPQFRDLVGLTESNNTSKLIEFVTLLHPNVAKVAQGSQMQVFGNKHFVYTIYTTGILKTEVESKNRTFYKL